MVAASGVVDRVPEVGWLPLHPPDALQDWALLAFHVNVTDSPASMVAALSCKLMVGGRAEEVLEPPLPDVRTSPPQAASNAAAATKVVPRARCKRQARQFIHDLPVWRLGLPFRHRRATQITARR